MEKRCFNRVTVRRMDTGDYVNSPAGEGRNRLEKRENCHSGWSKVFWVVGVSFGLLCIIQSALNVSLRLQGIGFCNKSENINSTNVTLISAADISALLREKDQLSKENRELQANNSRLTGDNKMLNDQLSQHQDQIMELKMMLSETEQKIQSCPLGWKPYMSSCYWLSTQRMCWGNAKKDCEAKGAHLVILNDQWEKDVLHSFGHSDLWISLKAKQKDGLETWSWVDGSYMTYLVQSQRDGRPFHCAYSQQSSFGWVRAPCREQHYWACEKELK